MNMRINTAAGTIKCSYEYGSFSQKKIIFFIIYSVKIHWWLKSRPTGSLSLFIIKNIQFFPLREKLDKKFDK